MVLQKPTDDAEEGLPIDKSVLMCFDEKTGEFLWQMVHDKLEAGQVNDWPREGMCSTPTVEGGRAYYVSNRCEVVCLDLNGLVAGTGAEQASARARRRWRRGGAEGGARPAHRE